MQQVPEDAAAPANAPAGYWLGALESLIERADAFSQTGARVQWGWCRCACCPLLCVWLLRGSRLLEQVLTAILALPTEQGDQVFPLCV